MGTAAEKVMNESDELSTAGRADLLARAPQGFVPVTKANVAYWSELCAAILERGSRGMGDADWRPEQRPTRITLRQLQERRLVVRRSRAWRLRRGWRTVLDLLRETAVPTPPLTIAERPGPDLPTFDELRRWELVCRWLGVQPDARARLPILDVPMLGAVSSSLLRGMRKYRLVRHGEDCTWRLTKSWKEPLLALWHGVVRAEGEREVQQTVALVPYSVAAGIDTWYLNRIDESGLPTALRMTLDELQTGAKDEDDEVETPWIYDDAPLMMYRAGTSTKQGGGVSWSYIIRNPSLALLIRKSPLGGIVAQARLGSECLWRRTPLAALNELDLLARRMWKMGTIGRQGKVERSSGRWQNSQVHVAKDVANAPLELEQLDRYVSRSRKRAVFESAKAELATLYKGISDEFGDAFDEDMFFEGTVGWDAMYGNEDDLFGHLDPFDPDGGDGLARERELAIQEPVPVEERATSANFWGRRLSGVTWSPSAAVSFVAYDKVLEGRLRGKAHMEPIWMASGWDGKVPVTRHEARLRRNSLASPTVPFGGWLGEMEPAKKEG